MTILTKIKKELAGLSDKSLQENSRRFFKETIKCYGVRTSVVRDLAKKHFKELKDQDKKTIFALCEKLWKSGIIEESFIASYWTYSLRKQFQPEDFKIFEKWIKTYVNNWASCDGFCTSVMGEFLLLFPGYVSELKKWAKDENRWVKRAASVSLIRPAGKGEFISDVFGIARLLLKDNDDLVQKGYGWLLKVASQRHEQEVFDFVMKKKNTMPRTALRYAIENMPEKLKKLAMAK